MIKTGYEMAANYLNITGERIDKVELKFYNNLVVKDKRGRVLTVKVENILFTVINQLLRSIQSHMIEGRSLELIVTVDIQ